PYAEPFVCLYCSLYYHPATQDRHSFPTRRSSDLVQEQAALEVLARVEQFPRPVGHADDVLLDALQDAVGQDHVLRHNRRPRQERDRKSTRLNSSHVSISYAVFCLKQKIIYQRSTT